MKNSTPSHLRQALLFALLSAFPCSGAIDVSGVNNKSRNGSGTTATVEVTPEAGFTTTTLHNDAPFPVGVSTTINGTGYHEIVETKVPDGGGAAVVDTFQFIIKSPGRA